MAEHETTGARAENMDDKALSRDAQLLEKLNAIETLLEAQRKDQKKALFYRRLSTLFSLCLVVVIAVGLVNLSSVLNTATADLPVLIGNTNELVQQLNEVDFKALDSTLENLDKGVSEIDFEQLNASIENLSKVAESLANATRLFRG